MKLKTNRLLLRPWDESDAPVLYPLACDPDVGPRCGWKPHESEAESAEVIRNVLAVPETYAVVLRETGGVIGSMGLHRLQGQPGDRPELGYWIGKPYWGRGYAPEAARELMRRAFEDLGCNELWCAHFDFNAQSKRVIEKCGFCFRMTKEVAYSDGISHVTLYYALTREEWGRIR